MRKLMVALLLLLLGGACGSDDEAPTGEVKAIVRRDDTNDELAKHFKPDGTYVWCIEDNQGANSQTMSCDWLEYHKRIGDMPELFSTTTTTRR